MKDTTRKDLALRRMLSARLRPLALAIGVIISVGLPLTYYVLQLNALRYEAHSRAATLASRLPGASDADALVREFSRSFDAVVVRVKQTKPGATPEILVVTPLAERWWNRLVPVGVAPIFVGGETVGQAEVYLAQGNLMAITLALLVMSTAIGAGLAFLVYAVPVRVVGGMEHRLADLIAEQDSLITAGRVLASSLDLGQVLDRLTGAARSLRGADVVHIWLCDPTTGAQTLATQAGELRTQAPAVRALAPHDGLSGAVIAGRRPLVLADAPSDPRLVNRAWYAAEGLSSFLGVPMHVGDTVLGALSCISRTRREWTPNEIALAETLAGMAAVAIRNAGLFEQSEQRRRAAELLAQTGRELSQALDLEILATRIQESVRGLFGARTSGLYRYDAATGALSALGVAGDVGPTHGRPIVFEDGTGAVGLAVRLRRPIATPNVLTDARIHLDDEARARIEASGYRSVLSAPLLVKNSVVGALSVGDAEGRVFTDEEAQLLQTFADQAALALENARLYSEAMRREREAEELARLARVLSGTLDVADVGDRIAESVLPLFEARSSGLYTLESDGSCTGIAWGGDARTRYTVGQRFPAADGVVGWIVANDASVVSGDVLSEARFTFTAPRRSALAAGGNTAVLAVPLRSKGALIGVLAVADKPGRVFSDAALALLQAFADQAALALDNARLYQRAQRAYADLAEAQERLVRGETLRAMGELASGVAHHLNNLLAVILGRTQLALAKAPPDVARHLTIAERAILDGAEVIRRMRGFGRGQVEPDLAPLDLNEIVQEILELTRPRWEDEAHVRGVTIEASLDAGELPTVRGEIGPLREVLVNLVLNAVDAMPAGGRIALRTWADDDWVHCAVSDTGTGMSLEVQRRALEPFFTTKGPKSTGLGLSVNYGIVQRLGGELSIASDEGRGTTVSFTLPAAHRSAPSPAAAPAAPPRALRVLVIDDEREVRDMLAELLEAEGHSVLAAAGGAEGLAQLDGTPAIDVVLSDLGMPGMNGWEIARAVKTRRPDLPVVLVTGWGEDPEGPPEDRRAADVVIAKPVTPVSLRAALARAVTAGSARP